MKFAYHIISDIRITNLRKMLRICIGSHTYKVLLGSTRHGDILRQRGKSLTGG